MIMMMVVMMMMMIIIIIIINNIFSPAEWRRQTQKGERKRWSKLSW